MCGCALLRAAASLPTTGNRHQDAAKREALEENAREWQRRWGCPAVSRERVPLDPDLVAEAKHVATITSTEPADTCPFACINFASPWVAELTSAVSLSEWRVDLFDTLGRELTRVDVEALKALRRAQNECQSSNQKIADAKRTKPTR